MSWTTSLVLSCGLALGVCACAEQPNPAGPANAPPSQVAPATQISAPASQPSGEKTEASHEGLEHAKRDVAKLKSSFRTKSSEELIALIIPPPRVQFYGGYDYFYDFMANRAIVDELRSRGDAARPALKKHRDDKTLMADAINGPPGNTIGRMCGELLASISEPTTQSSEPSPGANRQRVQDANAAVGKRS